ncbi:MAG: carbohydrate ABC transporter permease [Ardenticatenia bacterium]|nr:carbohydrate ABC transporter permease [Ardenticatenia bacterium]
MTTTVAARSGAWKKGHRAQLWLRRLGQLLSYLILTVLGVAFLLPLYWMVTGSFKLQKVTMAVPPEFFPSNPTLHNWVLLFTGPFPSWRWLLNSVIVSLLTVVLVVIIAAMTGYGFGKKRFPGSKVLFFVLLSTMFLPNQVMLIPLLLLVRGLHLTDSVAGTYVAMALPMLSCPFGVFLVKQFASTIPDDLIDAGKIDGASEWQIFTRVAVPILSPALAALAIFTFNLAWNYFMWHLLVASDKTLYTIPVGVSYIALLPAHGKFMQDIGLMMAGGAFGAFFMIVFFLAFQQYFVKGITFGAVKG